MIEQSLAQANGMTQPFDVPRSGDAADPPARTTFAQTIAARLQAIPLPTRGDTLILPVHLPTGLQLLAIELDLGGVYTATCRDAAVVGPIAHLSRAERQEVLGAYPRVTWDAEADALWTWTSMAVDLPDAILELRDAVIALTATADAMAPEPPHFVSAQTRDLYLDLIAGKVASLMRLAAQVRGTHRADATYLDSAQRLLAILTEPGAHAAAMEAARRVGRQHLQAVADDLVLDLDERDRDTTDARAALDSLVDRATLNFVGLILLAYHHGIDAYAEGGAQ